MTELLPSISIIMPCYNAARYLDASIRSVQSQEFSAWELIIVNDGSTDESGIIGAQYAQRDSRISIQHKENGGYVSARLHGLRHVSGSTRYLLFFDADDVLHPEMLSRLYQLMENRPELGLACCNHLLIDANGNALGAPDYGIRKRPTAFGLATISENELYTPFISIFCWSCRMIEPMTLIRKEAYDKSSGWDARFGKGRGNIGDGTLLFSEIALTWKAGYICQPLYYYRKHPNQATADAALNQLAAEKVIKVWKERLVRGYPYAKDITAAIIAFKYRFGAFRQAGALKHQLRHHPLAGIQLLVSMSWRYLLSLQLLFFRQTIVFKDEHIV